jgi:hypothetical protein
MSDDNKGVRGPAAKLTTSEKWGDPPIWSPWNFQFPNPNREDQKQVSREALPTRMREMRPNSVETGHGPVTTRLPLIS